MFGGQMYVSRPHADLKGTQQCSLHHNRTLLLPSHTLCPALSPCRAPLAPPSRAPACCRSNASPALEGARAYTLPAQSELRFFVASGSTAQLMLTEGAAESFGVELQNQRLYTLTESNVAIFTWQGCTLQLAGELDLLRMH